jgi:ribonuclease-3
MAEDHLGAVQARMIQLQTALGYFFKNGDLLLRALTHKSYFNEHADEEKGHNERLEFLGDAVIDLVIGHYLMLRLPEAQEGELSRLRAALVNEQTLAETARDIELGERLRLGHGEESTGGREKESILADGLEALIGALYLDGGYDTVHRLIGNLFQEKIEAAENGELENDYKTKLQELTQHIFKRTPQYLLISQEGPDHNRMFEMEAVIKDLQAARGKGRTKKAAEQAAAKELFLALEAIREGEEE